MAMLLSMPHLLGGFKLEGSQLNARLDLGKRARSMFGKRYFVSDMCWLEHRLVIEYDSDLCHTGSERIANDSKRRNALLFMDYTAVTITRKQIYNFSELDKVAHIIAKRLGKRIRPRTEDFSSKQFALRAAVLGGSSTRSGQYLRFRC